MAATTPGPHRALVALAACLGVFALDVLSTSIWSITVLYLTLPGLVLLVLTGALLCRILWQLGPSGSFKQLRVRFVDFFSTRSFWWTTGVLVAVASSVLATTFVPAVVVYTWSAYTMPETDASLVHLGAVSHQSVNIWARDPEASGFTVTYSRTDAGGGTGWVAYPVAATLSAARDHTGTLQLSGLASNANFEYTVAFTGGASTAAAQSGRFRTLPQPLDESGTAVRFAFGSCSMKSQHAGFELSGFAAIEAMQPHFLLFLGDLIYTDVPLSGTGFGINTAAYRAHYVSNFRGPQLSASAFSDYNLRLPDCLIV
jgi:hypothetical protein